MNERKTPTNNPTSISLPASILHDIDAWADARGMTRSAAIAEVFARYQVVANDPPVLHPNTRAVVMAFLRGRRWTAPDVAAIGPLAETTLGQRVGAVVSDMSPSERITMIDMSERR